MHLKTLPNKGAQTLMRGTVGRYTEHAVILQSLREKRYELTSSSVARLPRIAIDMFRELAFGP